MEVPFLIYGLGENTERFSPHFATEIIETGKLTCRLEHKFARDGRRMAGEAVFYLRQAVV